MTLLEKKIETIGVGKGSGTIYLLKVKSLDDSGPMDSHQEIIQTSKPYRVDKVLYDRVEAGDQLYFRYKSGYLGYRWIDRIEMRN